MVERLQGADALLAQHQSKNSSLRQQLYERDERKVVLRAALHSLHQWCGHHGTMLEVETLAPGMLYTLSLHILVTDAHVFC